VRELRLDVSVEILPLVELLQNFQAIPERRPLVHSIPALGHQLITESEREMSSLVIKIFDKFYSQLFWTILIRSGKSTSAPDILQNFEIRVTLVRLLTERYDFPHEHSASK
jgi:hypothetical protein